MRADADPFVDPSLERPASILAIDLLLVLFMVNLSLQPPVEPDFGWHLRAGLDFFDRGGSLPHHDPYSHSMSDWAWVEHAWLTDVVLAAIYRGLGGTGLLGIMGLFAALTLAAFVIGASRTDASRTDRFAAVVGSLWVALPFLGARTQLVSLLGLALVLWLYRSITYGRSCFIWLYPPLFLIWANLHGGFIGGLLVLGLILGATAVLHVVEARWPIRDVLTVPSLTAAQARQLALSFVLSCGVTFVNPYGWRLHREIYESLTDRFMLAQLREWQPVSFEGWAGTAFLCYLVVVGGLAVRWYRRVDPIQWMLVAVSLVWSLMHWRNVTIFLVVAAPVAAESLQGCRAWVRRFLSPGRQAAVSFAVTLALGGLLVWLGADHLEDISRAGIKPALYFEETEYPIEAVQWLQTHRGELGDRLYNDYGYGGFLLWWMPGEKIFIDGRMPAWRIGNRAIFQDYIELNMGGRVALGILEKYGVDWGLIHRDSRLAATLMENPMWEKVYADPKVVIMRRRP